MDQSEVQTTLAGRRRRARWSASARGRDAAGGDPPDETERCCRREHDGRDDGRRLRGDGDAAGVHAHRAGIGRAAGADVRMADSRDADEQAEEQQPDSEEAE